MLEVKTGANMFLTIVTGLFLASNTKVREETLITITKAARTIISDGAAIEVDKSAGSKNNTSYI